MSLAAPIEAPPARSMPVARAMTRRDCPAVAALLSDVFGRPRSVEEVMAKYFPQPDTPSLSTVLEREGELAGFQGHVLQTWRVDGKRVRAVMGADLALRDAFRRLDYFLMLAERSGMLLRERRIDFIWGVPVDDARELNREVLGFDSLGPLPRQVCPVRLGRCLAAKYGKGPWHRFLPLLLRPLDLRFLRHRAGGGADLRLREVEDLDGRYGEFAASRSGDGRVSLVRTGEEWNRRFGAGARPGYLRILAENPLTGEMRGVMVLAAADGEHNGLRRGRILELETRDGDAAAARRLLARALAEARRRNWDTLDAWVSPGDPRLRRFQTMGFRQAGKARRELHVKSLFPDEFRLPAAPEAWRWAIGHGDEL